jgi:hypothetical protein
MEPVLHRSTPLQLVNEMSPVRGAGALARSRNLWGEGGAPDTIRTCDLHLRRATLYPAELRVRERLI